MSQFATNHEQVREIIKGTPYDVDAKQEVDGVQMLWNEEAYSANGENGASWSLSVFFMSQVTQINNDSNDTDVRNECVLICSDLINFFQAYDYANWSDIDKNVHVEIQKSWSTNTFKERFNSLYSGAFVQFSINSSYNYNRCNIPTDAPTPVPPTLEQTVNVFVNGVLDQSFNINAYEDNTINITP